jgi:sulfur carrier protein ThiS
MRIEVRLQLNFRDKAPHGEDAFHLDAAPGTTVADVLKELDIADSTPKVIIVNGRAADPARELVDGDQLTLFPPVAGG